MERIYGRNPVMEALRSGQDIDRIYILDSVRGEFEKEIRRLCKDAAIPLHRVPKSKLDLEIPGNHQGIYAVISTLEYVDLEVLLPQLFKQKKNPVLLLLDGIQDIRNVGAIARSAEVFGADAIVIPAKKSAPVNEIAIKASAGALLHLPVSRVKSLATAIEFLGKNGVEVIGADVEGDTNISDLNLMGPLGVVLGAEGKGIDRNLKIYFDHLFFIPQAGEIQSLNVSVAAGIILYEIHKSRL
ncbi:MAG: 23S rRNA (guanosine(2251)-2'-O)-methyltransferase RlmB [Saprospiraceae bacterium]|nr:23S rRNA (guanosine(2251)-2'-O)-methyltransferase RlmB [Saprospiraceae bacterium]